MNLAVVYSRASVGIKAPPVTIEVHLSKGLPGLSIVGLPETAVKESRHRVRSAIVNSGFEFPIRRITVNLAPADLPKEGGRFDLPIALGILAASGQIPKNILQDYEFAGELALSGEVRPCRGVLSFAIATRTQQRKLIIPSANVTEASRVGDFPIYAVENLQEVCAHLTGRQLLLPHLPSEQKIGAVYPDLSEVQGQAHGRRALEIAAAGGHSLLMVGPPGAGKTMLATRLPGILPPINDAEALEVAAVYSLCRNGFDYRHWQLRPFRKPHHTASGVALVGGSSPPYPGEISLAHHGVLFLDELPEFGRAVLETLREPLEAGVVTISRASHQVEFPANFQFIAAMNPCPCGYLGDIKGHCHCTAEQVQRYQHKISGPLLDRIDMHLALSALPSSVLLNKAGVSNEPSDLVQHRVCLARKRQMQRQNKINTVLTGEEITQHCALDTNTQLILAQTIEALNLSARAYHRILKLARTIADLAASHTITQQHIQEAINYRRLTSNLL